MAKTITPVALFEELLRLRQSTAAETVELKLHNHDRLCGFVHDQFETMLGAFEKYENISYVTQGPRDQGVDILIKESREDAPDKLYAIQVKSPRELADRENDVAVKLKTGFFDARENIKQLERYYILLFADQVSEAKRITALTNEFAKNDLIRVIGPRNLHSFINLSTSTIAAIVDRHLNEDDYVSNQARSEMERFKPAEVAFLLSALCDCLARGDDKLSDDFPFGLPQFSKMEERFGVKQWRRAIELFSDGYFEIYASGQGNRMRTDMFSGIRALYFDFQVRYEESSDVLYEHLFEFLVRS